MYVKSMVGIFSQCMQISNHIVYFKYITMYFVNYTLIKKIKYVEFIIREKHGGSKFGGGFLGCVFFGICIASYCNVICLKNYLFSTAWPY